jgi:hypothetical protein
VEQTIYETTFSDVGPTEYDKLPSTRFLLNRANKLFDVIVVANSSKAAFGEHCISLVLVVRCHEIVIIAWIRRRPEIKICLRVDC